MLGGGLEAVLAAPLVRVSVFCGKPSLNKYDPSGCLPPSPLLPFISLEITSSFTGSDRTSMRLLERITFSVSSFPVLILLF